MNEAGDIQGITTHDSLSSKPETPGTKLQALWTAADTWRSEPTDTNLQKLQVLVTQHLPDLELLYNSSLFDDQKTKQESIKFLSIFTSRYKFQE